MLPNDPPGSWDFLCPRESIEIVAWTKYLKGDINSGISTSVDRLVQRQRTRTFQKLCILKLKPALAHIPLPSGVDHISSFLLVN